MLVLLHCTVVPTVEVASRTDPLFNLECTSMGAPGVITWTYSGSSRTYTSGRDHQIVQSLLNGVSSTFRSTLTFLRHPFSSDTGERICVATSTYISTNSSETNTSTVIGTKYLQVEVGD